MGAGIATGRSQTDDAHALSQAQWTPSETRSDCCESEAARCYGADDGGRGAVGLKFDVSGLEGASRVFASDNEVEVNRRALSSLRRVPDLSGLGSVCDSDALSECTTEKCLNDAADDSELGRQFREYVARAATDEKSRYAEISEYKAKLAFLLATADSCVSASQVCSRLRHRLAVSHGDVRLFASCRICARPRLRLKPAKSVLQRTNCRVQNTRSRCPHAMQWRAWCVQFSPLPFSRKRQLFRRVQWRFWWMDAAHAPVPPSGTL
jgi:hypothetical protein